MFKKIIGFAAIIIGLGIFSSIGIALYLNSSPNTVDERVSFSITRGESLDAIAKRLESQGVIRSALFLRISSRMQGTEQSFKLGNYAFSSQLTTAQIHDLIVNGQQVNIRVTIPEGYTRGQIARILEDKRICQSKDFLAAVADANLVKESGLIGESAEGYLFPDTYLFPEDYPSSAVVAYMLENWKAKVGSSIPDWGKASPVELRRNLIIASIVEREYITPSEAPLMASVFFNRLAIHKPLESCATVVYVMTEVEGRAHPKRLFYRDLARESPYNTYLHSGLPPGPISNPGITAIKAAFSPASTDYLYFVLMGPTATKHHFSKTFAEHNQASVFYLKGQG